MYEDEFQINALLHMWNPAGPPSAEGVAELFRYDPKAAQRTFPGNKTLLHSCMEYYSDRRGLVQEIIEAYPEALIHHDNEGYLPIHRALAGGNRGAGLDLVKLMVLKAHLTVFEQTHSGQLPLHLACRHCDVSVVQYLIDCFPELLSCRDNSGRFPLDYALFRDKARAEVLTTMLDKCSSLLYLMDDSGDLPLHRVLRHNHHNLDIVVETVTDVCPAALRFQNAEGQTPLLLACEESNSLSQIYSLIRQWPEQVTTQPGFPFYETSFNGELFASSLVSKSLSFDRVRQWIERHPEEVLSPDIQGRLPIHYAAASPSNDAVAVVQFLIEKSGECAATADKYGRLPLHYVSGTPLFDQRVAEVLIDAFPGGLISADKDERFPWHYGDCARNSFISEKTFELFPDSDINLDLVPDEIRWDILQVIGGR
eukprot:scaffold5048_cov121-Cylindrotheca_fusiformis.AAC.2